MKGIFMKKQLGPSDAFFPVPAALIVSGVNENANIITLAWVGIASSTPPTIGISIRKPRYSLELIRETNEFSVNFPSAAIFKEVDYCGITTGGKRNKFKDTGLTPIESKKIKPPIIKECPYNAECKVSQEIIIGEYAHILGEVLESHVDEDKADDSKRAGFDMAKINPLVYFAEAREYWTVGEMLGYGFDVGKEIKEKITKHNKANSADAKNRAAD
jgi:flavin reductase (DIM6/NTAB) family NADH-FMN oxidoreductase RutF